MGGGGAFEYFETVHLSSRYSVLCVVRLLYFINMPTLIWMFYPK